MKTITLTEEQLKGLLRTSFIAGIVYQQNWSEEQSGEIEEVTEPDFGEWYKKLAPSLTFNNFNNKNNWMELSLYNIIQEYKDGNTEEALDGDEVDGLLKILSAKVNLQEGNITNDEYDEFLENLENKELEPLFDYVIVDELNIWLAYGENETEDCILNEAKNLKLETGVKLTVYYAPYLISKTF